MNHARLVGIAALMLLFTVACGNGTPSTDMGDRDVARDTGGGNDTGTPDMATGDVPRPDTGGQDTAPADMTPTDTGGTDTVSPGDGGTGGTPSDGGQCQVADPTGAPQVEVVNGNVNPAGQGGEITTGRWVLQEVVVDTIVNVKGTVQGVLQVLANNATSGEAGVAFVGQLSAVGQDIDFNEGGSGSYTTNAEVITISVNPACGTEPPIDMGEYTATEDELTLWATLQVGSPIGPVDVAIEATFAKE